MNGNKEKKSKGGSVLAKRRSLSDYLSGIRLKRIISALICFVLAATVTGTRMMGGIYPLGIALTASVSGITNTVSTLLGVLVGSVRIDGVGGIYAMSAAILGALRLGACVWLSPGVLDKKKNGKFFSRMKKLFSSGPTFAGVVNAITAETGLYSGIMLRENYRIRLALSACAALLAGAWSVVWGGYVYYDLIGAVLSLIVTPVITYLFYSAGGGIMSRSHLREVGVYSVFAAVTLSLHQVSGGEILPGAGFDLGVLFAFIISTFVSLDFGIYRGVLAGLLCGMVMDPTYAPVYGIAALVSAVFGKYSVIFATLAAGACGVA